VAHFRLPKSIVRREEFLLSLCSGKRVLHLGCTDTPFTDESIAAGRWLHAQLSGAASECVGVDIDANAIRRLRDQYDVCNIVHGDAESLEQLDRGRFDVVVAGELMEHLGNPARFLASARAVLKPDGVIAITTTNAFCFRRMLRVSFGSESVHPDHHYYFSHSTLRRLVVSCGYTCVEQHNYRILHKRPLFPYFVESLAMKVNANLGEGIVLVCKADPTTATE
jgi:2-polyprenyl-3-methyl-5-hydroxy-6-metoxy-1,4-benzoquinol methylase